MKGKISERLGHRGTVVFQSGQPYSIIDYTGAVGSIFYGVNDGITNPDCPARSGLHAEERAHGRIGRVRLSDNPQYALQPGLLHAAVACIPAILNGAIPPSDTL